MLSICVWRGENGAKRSRIGNFRPGSLSSVVSEMRPCRIGLKINLDGSLDGVNDEHVGWKSRSSKTGEINFEKHVAKLARGRDGGGDDLLDAGADSSHPRRGLERLAAYEF